MSRYYHMCSRNIGRPVYIRTVDGREYRGVINRVTNSHVFIQPMGRRVEGEESQSEINQKAAVALSPGQKEKAKEIGPGWGRGRFFPFGGFFAGFGIGIAFGVIGTLAFLPFFW